MKLAGLICEHPLRGLPAYPASRFVKRLSACTSRGCARPCVVKGAVIYRIALHCAADGSYKITLLFTFVLHRLRHALDIRLTPRPKTLQSP